MKKKTYIQPSAFIVTVRTTHMISTSITGTNVEDLGYGGNTNGVVSEGAAKANNYSVWDDDWNE